MNLVIKFISKKTNHMECKKEDFISPYCYQILHFGMTFEYSTDLKSYIFLLPVFTWNQQAQL